MTLVEFTELIRGVKLWRGEIPKAVVLPLASQSIMSNAFGGMIKNPRPGYTLTVMGIPTSFEDRARPLVRL